MRCFVVGTNGCLDLRRRASALGWRVSPDWSRWLGSMVRCARGSAAPLQRSPVDWMPARIGKLSVGVGHRHPVTNRKASLMTRSMRRVWALRHQTGAQYSAVEWSRSRVTIRSVFAAAPQAGASKPPQECEAWCQLFAKSRKVSAIHERLSNVTPTRYLDSEQKDRDLLLRLTFSSCLARRWTISIRTTLESISKCKFN